MELFKPCPYCGEQAGQVAVLTQAGLFCDNECVRRYINAGPLPTVVIQITQTHVDQDATCTVKFTNG
jgi:hypothetical protein